MGMESNKVQNAGNSDANLGGGVSKTLVPPELKVGCD